MSILRRHYIVLILLIGVFIAPGLSAYLFYLHPQWLHATTTNRGHFLTPPVLLSELRDPKWQLLLWSPKTCDASCMQKMEQLARIRVALGRKFFDVDVSLILGSDANNITTAQMKTLQTSGSHVIKLSAQATNNFLTSSHNYTFFIANPEHYIVLSYKNNAESDDLFQDIKHVLTK